MRPVVAVCVVASLASILIIVKETKAEPTYEELLEKAREHRNEEQSGAANNNGNSAIGWRRKRHLIEMNPRIDEKTAKSFASTK